MADWPVWVWVLIALVALIIIGAIIFGTRQKDQVDPDGPFSDEEHGAAPMEPRRGFAPDPVQDNLTEPVPEPVPQGRRMDERSLVEEDEETLTGPLAGPGEDLDPEQFAAYGTPATDDEVEAYAPQGGDTLAGVDVAEEGVEPGYAPPAPADELAEEFATESRTQQVRSRLEEETFGREEPVEDFAAEAAVDEPTEPTPAAVAADEPLTDTLSQDAVEDEDAEDEDVLHAHQWERPGSTDSGPATHADAGEYGEPLPEAMDGPEDDVPRDELGRRLDPYGNPVD